MGEVSKRQEKLYDEMFKELMREIESIVEKKMIKFQNDCIELALEENEKSDD